MGKVYLGNEEIRSLYIGSSEMLRVYLGDEIIYDRRVLDPSTQVLLEKAEDLGYSTPINIYALDDLIKGMKNIGMWGLLDVFYVFASDLGSYANFRLLNVVNPDKFNATGFGGLEWNSSGVKANGVNSYIDTNYIPNLDAIKYRMYNASRGAVVNADAVGSSINNYLIDSSQEAAQTNALLNNSNIATIQNRINTTQSGGIKGNYTGLGLKIINRTSNVNFNSINKDLTESFNNTNATGIMNSTSQRLLRNNSSYSQIGLSCYFIGENIPYQTAQDFRFIFNNYLTEIGLTPIS